MRLDGKRSASVDVVLEVPQGSNLGLLLCILYTPVLIHIVGSHIADDTMNSAVIPTPLSCPQVMESLNQNLVAINSWCLK